MRWLWSANAIQCHLAFGVAGAIFVSLWFGDKAEFQKFLPGNDWIWLALLLVVGYPFLLFLLWFEQRHAEREAGRELIATLTEPEKERARRVKWRRGSLLVFIAVGCAADYFGRRGWLVNGLPAQYLGDFLLGMAALGLCRVNIWYGGPFDPRFDPQIETLMENEQQPADGQATN